MAQPEEQWDSTLRTYAYPVFGNLPVAAVDTALVVKVLDPIWSAKPETASRLRGRIEAVLDFATVRAHRVAHSGRPAILSLAGESSVLSQAGWLAGSSLNRNQLAQGT